MFKLNLFENFKTKSEKSEAEKVRLWNMKLRRQEQLMRLYTWQDFNLQTIEVVVQVQVQLEDISDCVDCADDYPWTALFKLLSELLSTVGVNDSVRLLKQSVKSDMSDYPTAQTQHIW